MAQIATTIRMDSELKEKFDTLCEEFGMSINTAFNIFAKAVVRSRSIPFKIEADDNGAQSTGWKVVDELRAQYAQYPELSLTEVNDEIREYRKSKNEKR